MKSAEVRFHIYRNNPFFPGVKRQKPQLLLGRVRVRRFQMSQMVCSVKQHSDPKSMTSLLLE